MIGTLLNKAVRNSFSHSSNLMSGLPMPYRDGIIDEDPVSRSGRGDA